MDPCWDLAGTPLGRSEALHLAPVPAWASSVCEPGYFAREKKETKNKEQRGFELQKPLTAMAWWAHGRGQLFWLGTTRKVAAGCFCTAFMPVSKN